MLALTEDLYNYESIPDQTLNNNDFEEILRNFHKDEYVIIVNFLKEEYCQRLRTFGLNILQFNHQKYPDYQALNFNKDPLRGVWFPLLTNISDEIQLNLIKDSNYIRGWVFLHDNYQTCSVKRHRDGPAKITLNVWVTPDECIDKNTNDYNGVLIHREQGTVHVPYKYNRAMMFYSNTEHESQLARFKEGENNKKVNYTFLYG